MANILENYLDNLADAIRLKTGETADIEAMDFASKIKSIPQNTTGIFQEKTSTLTTSGATSITPDSGYDGMTKVTVTPKLQAKTVNLTSTGKTTITADSGNAGLSSVAVTPTLQSKSVTVTSSGTTTITPDDNYAGLSSVAVTASVSSGCTSDYLFSYENAVSGSSVTKTFTVPASSTQAYFYVVSTTEGHYTNYGDGISATSAPGSITCSRGTIVRDLYTRQNAGFNCTYLVMVRRWKYTKTAGTAATVKFTGQNAYGGSVEIISMVTN